MGLIGVLGGMGPAATVDFMGKLVALTPARRDQDHLPVLVANLPRVPDRSSHIVGDGPDPMPQLLRGISLLNDARAGLIAVPSNTSHHWHVQMQAASAAPVLHIATICVARAAVIDAAPVMVLATRGTMRSGFYQRALSAAGIAALMPDERTQALVDSSIADVKGANLAPAVAALGGAILRARAAGAKAVILGCTELPIAAQALSDLGVTLIDSTLELAREAVRRAIDAGWQQHDLHEAEVSA